MNYRVLIFLAVFALNGCTIGTPASDLIKVTNLIPTPQHLKSSMAVDKVDYIHTFIIEGSYPKDFKEALSKTLDIQILLAPANQQPKYKISVDLDYDASIPMFDSRMSYTVIANYMIYSTADNKLMFERTISTKCDREKVPLWKKLLGGKEEADAVVYDMMYCAEHDNIERFIQLLNTITVTGG